MVFSQSICESIMFHWSVCTSVCVSICVPVCSHTSVHNSELIIIIIIQCRSTPDELDCNKTRGHGQGHHFRENCIIGWVDKTFETNILKCSLSKYKSERCSLDLYLRHVT